MIIGAFVLVATGYFFWSRFFCYLRLILRAQPQTYAPMRRDAALDKKDLAAILSVVSSEFVIENIQHTGNITLVKIMPQQKNSFKAQ
jgi:hypothetical protein